MEKHELIGVVITARVLYNTNLSSTDKIVFSAILGLSKKDGYCFASNDYLARIGNVTKETVSRIISKLKRLGVIDVKMQFRDGTNEIEKRIIVPIVKNDNTYKQNQQYPVSKKNINEQHKKQYPIDEKGKDIIKNIKNNNKDDIDRGYSDEYLEQFYAN